METVFKADNISYSVDEKNLINSFSLEVLPNEKVALLGSNGAGKSTLIDIFTKNIIPDSGEVSFFGNQHFQAVKDRVGVSFDDITLISPLFEVQELIAFVKSLYSINAEELDYYVEYFGLKSIWNKQLRLLSKGEFKKVSLTLSLFHNPDFIILDEPTSYLDPFMKDSFWKELERKDQVSTLFTSHSWDEVEKRADKVAFIHQGELLYPVSTVEHLLSDAILQGTQKVACPYFADMPVPPEKYHSVVYDKQLHLFGDPKQILKDYHCQSYSVFNKSLKDVYQYLLSQKSTSS